MLNIKAIVEKIKSSYPEIRVEEKVKISKQFIADYVIIQGITIKAIFTPYKKIPDNMFVEYVRGENANVTYYYDSQNIYIGVFEVNAARLIRYEDLSLSSISANRIFLAFLIEKLSIADRLSVLKSKRLNGLI